MAAEPDAPKPAGFWDHPIGTWVVLFIVAVGAFDLLIDGSLSGDFKTYIDTIQVPLAGLLVGRGIAARKAG